MDPTIEEREAAVSAREQALRADRLRFELSRALGAAKCRAEALNDATAIMSGSCEADFGEDGGIAKLTIGGKEYGNVADAASAFLGARKYFVDAEQRQDPKTVPTQQSAAQAVQQAYARTAHPQNTPPATRASASFNEALESGYSAGDLCAEGWTRPAK